MNAADIYWFFITIIRANVIGVSKRHKIDILLELWLVQKLGDCILVLCRWPYEPTPFTC